MQDLILAPQVIRFRRERWVTPDGQEIVAPLPPEVSGHFGPGIVRFVLMQHVQGQVTVERLLAQLRGLGVRISKGQIVTLLTANKDAFHTEKDALLEAGLATAAWVTVDDSSRSLKISPTICSAASATSTMPGKWLSSPSTGRMPIAGTSGSAGLSWNRGSSRVNSRWSLPMTFRIPDLA